MIRLCIISLFLISFSSYSSVEVLRNPVPNGSKDFQAFQGAGFFFERSGDALYFEYDSSGKNEDGICRSLGYEAAIKGSSRGSFFKNYNVLSVSDHGDFLKIDKFKKRVRSIKCNNKTYKKLAKIFYFFPPKVPGLKNPICISGNFYVEQDTANTVCRLMGYKKSIHYVKDVNFYNSKCVSIDNEGHIVGISIDNYLRKVACVK